MSPILTVDPEGAVGEMCIQVYKLQNIQFVFHNGCPAVAVVLCSLVHLYGAKFTAIPETSNTVG